MPLDPNADLALKRKHEARLLSQLRVFTNQLATELQTGLSGSYTPNLVGMGRPVLRSILREHYRQVGEEFSRDLSSALPSSVSETPDERGIIDAQLVRMFDEAADEQSQTIIESAAKLAWWARTRAYRLVNEDDELTVDDVPLLAARLFKRRQRGRSITQATTETQWASERAKAVEAFVLSGVRADQPKYTGAEIKVWRTQGDTRVRGVNFKDQFNHFNADGQQATVEGAFTVSGEMLRWPGDMGLGASLGNVINCRCSAIYDVDTLAELRELFEQEIFKDPNPLIPIEPDDDPTGVLLLLGERLDI